MEPRTAVNVYLATFVGDSQYFAWGTPVRVYEKVRSYDSPVRAGETRGRRTATADIMIGKLEEEPWFGIGFTNVLADIKYQWTDH